MQAVMETLFDVIYLCTVIVMGISMIKRAEGRKIVKLFGSMAVLLGAGDAFHLVPRAWALCTDGLANHAAALGFGKFVTSITMTIFYVILYHIWRERYEIQGKQGAACLVYGLAAIRVLLCFHPGNQWLRADAPITWGIYRNIPFAALGAFLILLWYQKAKHDRIFRYMWLAVTLSFGFYIPVVLWADIYPITGMLMIPKTCAYVWVVWMGFELMKDEESKG